MTSRLRLRFERDETRGATILRLDEQDPPWKVVRAFPLEHGQTLVHLGNVSGGVLGGDDLQLHIDLGPLASAQVTSTGATRVYRTRAGAQPARLITHIRLAPNAMLELLPDPLIPFAGSRFEQRTVISLEPGATLFCWEVLTPGREGAGETFRYDDLRMETRIESGGVPILIERFRLQPQLRPLDSSARLAEFRYLASLYVCRGAEPDARWVELVRVLSSIAAELTGDADEVRWGVSALPRDGLVVRGLSQTGHLLQAALYKFWRAAKLPLTGQAALLPRKIY